MNIHTNMDLTKSVVITTNFCTIHFSDFAFSEAIGDFCTIPGQQFPYYFTEKYFHNYKNTTPHYSLF